MVQKCAEGKSISARVYDQVTSNGLLSPFCSVPYPTTLKIHARHGNAQTPLIGGPGRAGERPSVVGRARRGIDRKLFIKLLCRACAVVVLG